MVAERIPNPSDSVRFAGTLLNTALGMDAEGCWFLLQRNRLGALPSVSTRIASRLELR